MIVTMGSPVCRTLTVISAAILGLAPGVALSGGNTLRIPGTTGDDAIPPPARSQDTDGAVFAAGQSPRVGAVRVNEVTERLSSLRIPFVANSGQMDPAVAFHATTFAGTVFVMRDGRIVYSLPGSGRLGPGHSVDSNPARTGGGSFAETVIDGHVHSTAQAVTPTRVSYLLGRDPGQWRSGLPTIEAISLGEVWPGISVEVRARGGYVEKVFTVEPGDRPHEFGCG